MIPTPRIDEELLYTALANNDPQKLMNAIIKHDRLPRPTGRFRSALMLSANQPKHLLKIPTLTTDAVILNLEDGVAPEMKRTALAAACYTISTLPPKRPKIIVRVNPLDEGGIDDIAALISVSPDAIRIPKIRSRDDLLLALSLIPEPIEIHCTIETKEAFDIISTLRPDHRITTFYLGILDLLASLEIPQNRLHVNNPLITYIMSRFVVKAKTIGVYPVSFVYQNYRDTEGFITWCQMARSLGYQGVGCLSPAQVEIAHTVFGPDHEEIVKAQNIVALFEAQAQSGITGFVDEMYGFIDEPIYKDALLTLTRV